MITALNEGMTATNKELLLLQALGPLRSCFRAPVDPPARAFAVSGNLSVADDDA